MLVVTPNLNFEGAPIFIFELARFLAGQPGVSVSVASAEDGPLRTRFEQAGLKVEIWPVAPLQAARTPAEFERRAEEIRHRPFLDPGRRLPLQHDAGLVGRPSRRALGKSSALYIHESSPVKRFFQSKLPVAMHDVVEEAFRLATRVVFTARATRDIHEELNLNDNFRTLASWVDLARIDQFAAAHDRAALRRKHGLNPDAVIIVNIARSANARASTSISAASTC